MDELTRVLPPDVTLDDYDADDPRWCEGVGWFVVDGDTFSALINTNENLKSWIEIKIRLFAINAKELKSKDQDDKIAAVKAKGFLHKQVFLKRLIFFLPGQKSFDRWLAWVWDLRTKKNISDLMVAEGHAEYKEY